MGQKLSYHSKKSVIHIHYMAMSQNPVAQVNPKMDYPILSTDIDP